MKFDFKYSSLKYILFFLWLFIIFFITINDYMDDAYIGFRYIDNFINGNGFVFNPGEHVEGITNIGWLFILVPFSFFLPITLSSKILGFIFIIITVCFLGKSLKVIKYDSNIIFTVQLCVVLSFNFWYFSLIGMETALFSAIIAVSVYLVYRENFKISCLLLGLAFTVRPEAFLILPFWIIISIIADRSSYKTFIYPVIIFTIPVIAIEVFRFFYYDAIVPNTFIAKSQQLSIVLQRLGALPNNLSNIKNIGTPFNSFISIFIISAGYVFIYKRNKMTAHFLLAVIITGYLFSSYAKEDWTGLGRYFAPYEPVSYLMLISGLTGLLKHINLRIELKKIVFTGLNTAVILAGIFNFTFLIKASNQLPHPWFVINSRPLIEPAKWISANLPEDCIIAARRIGCLSYFSERNIFDFRFGLTDKEVAEAINESGRTFTYPNDHLLKKRWKEIKPDYVIEDSDIINHLTNKSELKVLEIHGINYKLIKAFKLNKNYNWELYGRYYPDQRTLSKRDYSAYECLNLEH